MLYNKTALITGFDVNISARVTAELLSKEGYKIIAICAERKDYENKFKNYDFYYADLFLKESVENVLGKLKKICFDVIINCHAVLSMTYNNELRHEFFDFDYDSFDNTLRSNITSIAALCIGLKDNIKTNGCIINVTSSAAEEGAFATIAYNASKAALKNLSMSLSNNFGLYNGVRVNCVAPGWIPQSKDVVAGNIVDLANKITPISQYGEPMDVAFAILNLINNPYANNVNYKVDGGITSSYLMYLFESVDLNGYNTSNEMRQLSIVLNEIKKYLGKNKEM